MISQRDKDIEFIDRLMKEELGVVIDCEDFANEFVKSLGESISNYKGGIHILPICDDIYNKPIQLIQIKCDLVVLDIDLTISVYCFKFHSKKSIKNISDKLKSELDKICEENAENGNPYFIPLVAYSANKSLQNGENIEEALALAIEKLYRQKQKERLKGSLAEPYIDTRTSDDDTKKAVIRTLNIISDNHLLYLYNKNKHSNNWSEPLDNPLYEDIEKLRELRSFLSNRWRKDEIRNATRDYNTFFSQNTLLRLIDDAIPKMFRLIALSRLYADEDSILRRRGCMKEVRFGVLFPYSMINAFCGAFS